MPDYPAQTITIDPALLDPNPFQPKSRVTFTVDQLTDLVSIRANSPNTRCCADWL